MRGEPVHICLGSCRYPDFEPGDPVELSPDGWEHGLAANHLYTIGRVVKFENGILTVKREGEEPKEFHPCFWIQSTEEEIEIVRRIERHRYL